MPTRREEQHKRERATGVPFGTPTKAPRGFMKSVNSPAVEKARQRHARNEVRKKGGLRK